MSDTHSAEDIKKHVRVYLIVFSALAVLTVVTVAVSYLDLSIYLALVLALLIASVKAGLVGAYFMHLISERKVIFSMLAISLGLLLVILILFMAAYYGHEGTPLVS